VYQRPSHHAPNSAAPTSGLRLRLRTSLAVGAIATACALATVLRDAAQLSGDGWVRARVDERRVEPRDRSFPRATGRFETLRSADGCAVVTGQVQQDDCFAISPFARSRAIRTLARPGAAAKLGFTFDQSRSPSSTLHEADPDRWPGSATGRAGGRCSRLAPGALTAASLSIVPLARTWSTKRDLARSLSLGAIVLGIGPWPGWRDDAPFYLLAVVFARVVVFGSRPSVGTTFFARNGRHPCSFLREDRYHVVVTPMLCLLAAAALRTDAETTFIVPHEPEANAPRVRR